MGAKVKRAPLSMGDPSMISDWTLLLIPLTFISLSEGTSWGRNALTAGICRAAPKERREAATKRSHSMLYPL